MKRLLYPLIASALITIIPFLLTFEMGQNIVRGLFGYEYFALLLFIILIKDKLSSGIISAFAGMRFVFLVVLATLIITLFFVAWMDLQNLFATKGREVGWYGVLPFVTCGFAIIMVWKVKSFTFNAICLILFVSLIVHLFALNHYVVQPLAQFPFIDYLARSAPMPPQRKNIEDNFKAKYKVTDSVTITREYLDFSRSNVVVLVESWGIPLDINRFDGQLKVFDGVMTVSGIHNRMYSRTRTAEREDLMLNITIDSLRHRDTVFLPKVFADVGYRTTFLFGGDSLEQGRYKYIRDKGFEQVVYGNGLQDEIMALKMDSILADSVKKHFIAWTTTSTKFPLSSFLDIYHSDTDAVDSSYTLLLMHTLAHVANLAHKYPNVRFIVQGDHNPILSPIQFQERFYKRWVPFVVLN